MPQYQLWHPRSSGQLLALLTSSYPLNCNGFWFLKASACSILLLIHEVKWSECCSVMSDFLLPHELYGPWNSPGQNTGVGSLSLLQGIFPTQELNPGLPYCRQILYQLSHKGNPLIHGFVLILNSASSWLLCPIQTPPERIGLGPWVTIKYWVALLAKLGGRHPHYRLPWPSHLRVSVQTHLHQLDFAVMVTKVTDGYVSPKRWQTPVGILSCMPWAV